MKLSMAAYEDRPREFWASMGPFFATRAMRKAMPYLVDDDGYVWFVATIDGLVVGFGSLHVDKGRVGHLHGLWVDRRHRGNGIARQLVEERLKWLMERGVRLARATTSPDGTQVLMRCGFAEVGRTGKYVKLEKSLEPR